MLKPEEIAGIVSGITAVIGAIAAFIKRANILQFFNSKKDFKKLKAEKGIAKYKLKAANQAFKKIKKEENVKDIFSKLADSLDKDAERIEKD